MWGGGGGGGVGRGREGAEFVMHVVLAFTIIFILFLWNAFVNVQLPPECLSGEQHSYNNRTKHDIMPSNHKRNLNHISR